MGWGLFAKKEEPAAEEQEEEEEEEEDPGGVDDSDIDGPELRCRKNHESFVMMRSDDPGPNCDLVFFNVGTCPIEGCRWAKLKPHNCWSWRSENACRSYLVRHLHISGQKGHSHNEDECIVLAMEAEILSKTYSYEAREAQRTKKRKEEEEWHRQEANKRRKQEAQDERAARMSAAPPPARVSKAKHLRRS